MNDNNIKRPDLVFIFPETFPDERITEEIASIKEDNLDLRIIKKNSGAYNSFEWIIPTAFGAYILKPYFDSFLSEAGKDHYEILKKCLSKLIEKGKIFKSSVVSSTQSVGKPSKKYTQSLTISLEFQTINNKHIKLLFDNNLNVEDWNNALKQLLELIIENYEIFPNDRLSIEIDKLKIKEHGIIYSVINPTTKKLEFKDDFQMIEKYNQNHS